MNSHSPLDADYMEQNSTSLLSMYGGKSSDNLIEGKFNYSTISVFLSYPLIDVCREYVASDERTTFPTPILKGVSKHKDVRLKKAERIDYVFVPFNMNDKVVDAFIFNGKETRYLSDHYLIGVDLLIENK